MDVWSEIMYKATCVPPHNTVPDHMYENVE